MSNDGTYNGWTNYETWCFKLWMDNEEDSHTYWANTAALEYRNARRDKNFTRKEGAAFVLADKLQKHFEAFRPDLGASVWADLLGAALSRVSWSEIAYSLLEDEED